MLYKRCGDSGILLPAISLGLWHNFGDVNDFSIAQNLIHEAFDLGITHFDLANNYGPPYGSAETNFGKILKNNLSSYRDELLISTKAGYDMWPGPYGDWGSRKYLIASCDQSLKRMGLDYVDVFYSHRPDPNTPMEETMGALDYIVRSGRALYVGISRYNKEQTQQAVEILNKLGTPCLIHQEKYSLLYREPENDSFKSIKKNNVGCIVFSPLAQGLLSDKYLEGIPGDSRAASSTSKFLNPDQITGKLRVQLQELNCIAKERGQSLSQMAIAWLLHNDTVTSVLVGASKVEQIRQNVQSLENVSFSQEELSKINAIIEA